MSMKDDPQFKTLRHIETVRNYLNEIQKEFITRGETHDQSKLQEPELSVFNEFTSKLSGITYGSDEYLKILDQMKPALKHHYASNRHHPEYFDDGVFGMTLIDLIEMLCDWKASSLRHDDGDIWKSLSINAKRFNISSHDGLYRILENTVDWLESIPVKHHAQES